MWAAVVAWAGLGLFACATDLRRAVIPGRVVWAAGAVVATLLALAALSTGQLARFGWAAVGLGTVAAAFELIWRRWPDRVGFGDIRLIWVNSLLAGWWGPAWSWWALMAGALAQWPAAAVALARHGRHARVRWAPGLVAGTAAVVALRLWADGPAS